MASRKARRRAGAAAAPRGNGPAAQPPPPPAGGPKQRAASWALLAALLAGAALAYAPALDGQFHWDDWTSIQDNMVLRTPAALTPPSPRGLLGPSRRITEITFALDYRAVGLATFRYHAVSLALHLLASALAFVFTRGLLFRVAHPRAAPLALVAAGMFALHPIQSEAVAYAAQRSEVLASAFYLLCLVLLSEAAARGRTPRAAAAWGGGLISWLLGMGSKTIAITAPAAFVMEEAVVAPPVDRPGVALRPRFLRALALAAPLLALAAWSVPLHLRAFASAPEAGVGATGISAPSPSSYFLTQLRVFWLYLRLLAWPDALGLDRTFPASHGLDIRVAIAGAGVVAVLATAIWLWVRAERARGPVPVERMVAFGIFWWFLVLAPSSSVIPVSDLAVEHRVYLAALGPILVATVCADAALHRLLSAPRAGRAGLALAGAALLALGVALHGRAQVWRTEVALWRDAAALSPDNARVLTNLGLALHQKGDLAGAEDAYRRAWAVVHEPIPLLHLSRNFAALLEASGRPAEALGVLDRGLRVAPNHPDLLVNRAVALAQSGRVDEAISDARLAAQIAPGSPLIRNALGQVLTVHRDWAPALAEFRAAAALDPGSATYLANQAIPLYSLGRKADACAALSTARARLGAARLPADAERWWTLIGCSQ
jgi:protein O-mannosyl-transferase